MQAKYFINNFLVRLQIPFIKESGGVDFLRLFWKLIKKSVRDFFITLILKENN